MTTFFVFDFLKTRTFQVTVLSDIHWGTSLCDWKQCGTRVESAFKEVLDKAGDNLIISGGDNTDASEFYDDQEKASTLRTEYKKRLLEIVGSREFLWANGNHDRETYLSGSEYYSRDKNNWRFIVIHTTDVEGEQYTWLTEQLKTEKNKIVIMHHPVFKQGKKDVLPEYENLVSLFKENKVSYVLSGHWHGDHYERNLDGVIYRAIPGLTVYDKTNYLTLALPYRKIDTTPLPDYVENFLRKILKIDFLGKYFE